MSRVFVYNRYHIGDCLISAHLLRALAKQNPGTQFYFFLNGNVITQISEAVEDLPNIHLRTFESLEWDLYSDHSINLWKNAAHHWEHSRYRWEWAEHTLEHHAWSCQRMGFRSPFSKPTDLLFDYPKLGPAVSTQPRWASSFFICNSDPQSGQLAPMRQTSSGYLDDLIWKLGQHHSILTTQPAKGALCTQSMGHSVSMIGNTSVFCEHHIMVATGPMWPTLNTHNHHLWTPERKRIVILDNGEKLNLPWIQQVSRVEEAEEILKGANLL